MKYRLIFLLLFAHFAQAQNPLERVISEDAWLSEVVNNPKYQVQIIYTQIDRNKENKPFFESFKLGVDANEYFYPASTVKMPAAFLALEKLNKLNILGLDKETPLEIHQSRDPQLEAKTDSTSVDLQPSVAQYIKKIFVVSDNDAYNRLYEFLGQSYLNDALQKKGYTDTQVIHRLGPEGFPFSFDDNQYTNPFSFYKDGKLIYHQGEVHSVASLKTGNLRNQIRGVAHINKSDELVDEPFDFTVKNFFSLQDLHDVLKAVIFPTSVSSFKRFDIASDDYKFLYQWMSETPAGSGIAAYENEEDNYVKFYWNGDTPGPIPEHIRIFNKVGWAYGFLTDVSYIIDTDNGLEYMIAATIHVNKNETYNDGVYEYDEIGLPFFSKLGKVIYNLELKRRRRHKPDFNFLELK